jgi:hypothetical protein
MHLTSNPTQRGSKNRKNDEIEHKRIGWMPKCRAATLADRRTKRNRTRSDQKRRAIAENS